jgi:hypothetical protein
MDTTALDKFKAILSGFDKELLVELCAALLDNATRVTTENKWEEIARDRDKQLKECKKGLCGKSVTCSMFIPTFEQERLISNDS